MKKAEVETKAKQDKVAEIKKLNAKIQSIKNEMSKYDEQLEDCKMYKQFLDNLTPASFFEEQRRRSVGKLKADDTATSSKPSSEGEVNVLTIKEEEETEGVDDDNVRPTLRTRVDPPLASPPGVVLLQDTPMYFQRPEQLLEKFTELEENNLFLIQMCQESEEQLEEVRAKLEAAKEKMYSHAQSRIQPPRSSFSPRCPACHATGTSNQPACWSRSTL